MSTKKPHRVGRERPVKIPAKNFETALRALLSVPWRRARRCHSGKMTLEGVVRMVLELTSGERWNPDALMRLVGQESGWSEDSMRSILWGMIGDGLLVLDKSTKTVIASRTVGLGDIR